MKKIKVLYVGDGESVNYLVTKGLSAYLAGGFVDESQFLRDALSRDNELEVFHLRPEEAMEKFPTTIDAICSYD